MIAVLLSALLGPGVGQLYNREFKKGWILLGVGLLFAVLMMMDLSRSLMPYLTQDVASMDLMQLAELADRISAAFSPSRSALLLICYGVMTGLWIYSIIDAWFGAKRRAVREATPKKEASS